jgi:mono/diheme cytochrome c family protein
MKSRVIIRAAVAVAMLFMVLASLAQAGAWAVVTLDDLPNQIVARQPFTIGFTVRQHGRTLRGDLAPIIRFDRAASSDTFTVTAQREGGSGHYSARVTLPSDGQWYWKVDVESFGMVTQPMPALNVLAVAPTNPSSTPASMLAGLIGSIAALGALLFWLRTRARPALAIAALAVLIALLGFASSGASTAVATQAAQPDPVERGKALFLAKGCAMCHIHDVVKADVNDYVSVETGPNLTHQSLSADYLREWLKDPQALKPTTEMPNLNLKSDEIEALTAFLTADGPGAEGVLR